MISPKQKKILAFPYSKFDHIICDGAVRSGKTSIMMVSFVRWAMENFDRQRFGICGKTVSSAIENIIEPFMAMSYTKKHYTIKWNRSSHILTVTCGNRKNIFEVFGGKDESSFALIQGRTLAGVLLDEVVLMPESFVNQALARCSVGGARFWFSCNPGSPLHWFKEKWIDRADELNALYIHFAMTDNPSLSEETLERYNKIYTGVFYQRYVLGEWVLAEGLIYPNYKNAIVDKIPNITPVRYALSIDYGTMNAFAVLLWKKIDNVWYATNEYYYSGRNEEKTKTDAQYMDDIEKFTADISKPIITIIDPSAASFNAALRQNGNFPVRKADNDVLAGIQNTAVAMETGKIKILSSLKAWQREVQTYVWDNESEDDRPLKENDHLMDAMRYFVRSMRLVSDKSIFRRSRNDNR